MFNPDAATLFGGVHNHTTFWARMLVCAAGNETVLHHELLSTIVTMVDLSCMHDAVASLVTEWTRVCVHWRWGFALNGANFGCHMLGDVCGLIAALCYGTYVYLQFVCVLTFLASV